MSIVRQQCASPANDLGFFFESAHVELADQARHLAMKTFAPDEERRGAELPSDLRTFERRCQAIAGRLAEARLFEAVVPPSLGGLSIARANDIDVRAVCVVREMLGWGSPLAEFVFAMQGLGSYPIVRAGTDAQHREFLPDVLAGRSLAAFAMTESEAGSDVGAMKTTARRDGEFYVLDGEKTFISNAGIAGHYVVFAKTNPEMGTKGVSAFVVRPSDPGFEFVAPITLLADHPIGTIRFEGLRIPATRRLGGEGDGFRLAMATLDAFRSTVGAAALGFAKRALDEALTRSHTRQQFGKSIGEFQTTQVYLAEMATELDAARLLVYRAAFARDKGADRITLEASMAKLYATEAAQRIVDRSVQIHGASGLVRGHVLERLYRDVRALRIYEGTTEIQRVVIAGILLGGEKARANEAHAFAAERETMRPSTPSDEVEPAKGPRPPLIPADATMQIGTVRVSHPDVTRKMKAVQPDKADRKK